MPGVKNTVRQALCGLTSVAAARAPLRWMSRRGLLPAAVWMRLPIEGEFEVGLPNGRTLRYVSVRTDDLARILYWRGLLDFEGETLAPFFELARRSDLVLDVGAFTGLFALLACAANERCRVIAFEPVPEVRRRLVANVAANHLEQRIEVRAQAVSNTSGTATLHVPAVEMPSSSSLYPGGFRGLNAQALEVPVTTIDEVCGSQSHVQLMKLDVEWVEDKVLEGMPRILAESRPTLIMECLPDGPIAAVERNLRVHGYRFFHLRREGPVRRDRIVPDNVYRNYLLSGYDDWRELTPRRSAS